MTERELIESKRKVEVAKTETISLKGQQIAILKQLKSDWGCASINEAEIKFELIRKETESLKKQLNSKMEELEEKLNER